MRTTDMILYGIIGAVVLSGIVGIIIVIISDDDK